MNPSLLECSSLVPYRGSKTRDAREARREVKTQPEENDWDMSGRLEKLECTHGSTSGVPPCESGYHESGSSLETPGEVPSTYSQRCVKCREHSGDVKTPGRTMYPSWERAERILVPKGVEAMWERRRSGGKGGGRGGWFCLGCLGCF